MKVEYLRSFMNQPDDNETNSAAAGNPRKAALFTAICAFWFSTFFLTPLPGDNVNTRLNLTTSIVKDHALRIDPYHLNTLDKVDLHLPILEDIQALAAPGIEVYFGVELNYTGCDQGFAYSRAIAQEVGFQFAIGGIHATYLDTYDLDKLVEIQHRHHLRTCQAPLVQVLVHPYWFGKGEFDRHGWPWFTSMKVVPPSLVRELGQASKETGTAIEINGMANLCNRRFPPAYVEEYYEFLSMLAQEGATFCCGSDAHDIGHLEAIQAAWQMAERLELPPDRIWRPDCAPIRA